MYILNNICKLILYILNNSLQYHKKPSKLIFNARVIPSNTEVQVCSFAANINAAIMSYDQLSRVAGIKLFTVVQYVVKFRR